MTIGKHLFQGWFAGGRLAGYKDLPGDLRQWISGPILKYGGIELA